MKEKTTIEDKLLNLKKLFQNETKETKMMLNIYTSYILGNSISKEDIKFANNQLKDLMKIAGFSTLSILPLSLLTIPLLFVLSKKYKINLLPDWFKDNIQDK